MNNVVFTDCNMSDLILSGSVISGCSFPGSTDLTGLELDKAMVDDKSWIDKLVEAEVKGADQLASTYKVGKSIEIGDQFTKHPEFRRFAARNTDKEFYIILKK